MRFLAGTILALGLAEAASAQQGPELEPIEDPAWEAMQRVEGVWMSEEKTRPDGSTMHFRLSFEPFGRHGRIYELIIEMLPDGGRPSVLWHGYKGWDPVEDVIYYFGASPLGRFSRGEVYLADDGTLVTEYEGTDAATGAIRIRDVFTFEDEDHFSSTTYSLRDGQWKPMLSDEWTRVKTAG